MLTNPVRIYLDTNIFIFAIERPAGVDSQIADLLVDLIATNPLDGINQLVTSQLFLAEALVMPYAKNDPGLIGAYEAMQTDEFNIAVEPVTLEILRAAAKVRSLHVAIKLPDAIHLASAVQAGCTHFLTADIALANQANHAALQILMVQPDRLALAELLRLVSPNA
jgi:predicted nucleic acid-binding protein